MIQLKNATKNSFPPGCEIRLISKSPHFQVKPITISELWKSKETKKLTIKAKYPENECCTLASFGLFSAFGIQIGEPIEVKIESVSKDSYQQAHNLGFSIDRALEALLDNNMDCELARLSLSSNFNIEELIS